MASDVTYDAIRAYIESSALASYPTKWENEEFTPPVENWLSVEVSGTLYSQMSIGAVAQADNRWDEDGVLWVHVMAPAGSGTKTQRQICKQVADLFRGALLADDSLEFMDAAIGLGEQGTDDGNFWRITVSVDWRRMEA